MVSPEDVALLIQDGESTKNEWKLILKLGTKPEKAEFIRDMLALVNAHGSTSAYMLVGVDNQGGVKGLGAAHHDDAHLQQLVNSLVEPPIRFTYRELDIEGAIIGCIEIQPSQDRFHVVSKRYQENERVLLDPGETWIRHGSSRRRPTAWDYKLLKEEYAQSHRIEPSLSVAFANGEVERSILPEWQKHRIAQYLDLVTPSLPDGAAKLYFRVRNTGSAQATNIRVVIRVPEPCVVIDHPYSANPVGVKSRNRSLFPQPKQNTLVIHQDELLHGFDVKSTEAVIVFPDETSCYDLSWEAHAGNMVKPTQGKLRLHVHASDVFLLRKRPANGT